MVDGPSAAFDFTTRRTHRIGARLLVEGVGFGDGFTTNHVSTVSGWLRGKLIKGDEGGH